MGKWENWPSETPSLEKKKKTPCFLLDGVWPSPPWLDLSMVKMPYVFLPPPPLSLFLSFSLSLFSLVFIVQSNWIEFNIWQCHSSFLGNVKINTKPVVWHNLNRIETNWNAMMRKGKEKNLKKKTEKKKKYEGGNEKKKKQKQKKKTKRVTRVRVLVRSIFHRRPLCVPTGQSFLSQPKCWAPNWQWSIYKIFIFQVLLRPPLRSTILIRKRLGNLPLFLLNSRLIFVFPLSLSFLFPSFSLLPLLPHLLRLLLSFAPHFPFTAEAVFQSI